METTTAETSPAEAAAAEPATAEATGAHASPAAETVGPRFPTARSAEAIAQAAEGVRSSECAFVVVPGVGVIRSQVPVLVRLKLFIRFALPLKLLTVVLL